MGNSRAVAALLVGAAVIVLSGCAVAPAPYATAAADPGADAVVEVTDENVRRAVDDLADAVASMRERTGTPGIAVAVVHDGETVYAEGFGVRDVDSGEPVDADTVFPLASMSKSVGATVIARAVESGVVSWDTPVAANLPGFTLADPWVGERVTIGDMYAHRSGLPEHAGDDLEDLGYDRAQVLQRLRALPLGAFREDYAYGNFDITAAAESVAVASGQSWEDLSAELLYEPLGMTRTSSTFADLEAQDNRALGHVPGADGWVVSPQQRQPDAQSPAGGVSSSVTDVATWMTMVLASATGTDDAAFLSASALVPAVSARVVTGVPDSADVRGGFYGYGFNVGTTPGGLTEVNHSGAFALGAGTTFSLLPSAGLGIVVLANGQANGVSESISHRFTDIAQFGAERRDWLPLYAAKMAGVMAPFGTLAGERAPADPAPARPLESYVGAYANAYFGAATIIVVDGALQLALGPTGRWPLTHWDGDVFTFALSGENGPEGSVSAATFDGDRLVLEFYDGQGLGAFER